MKTIICTLGFLAAPTSFASQQIRIDTVKYSGSANIHFNALQAEIAIEAVNLCGSTQAVKGIQNLSISITDGIGNDYDVAEVTQDKNKRLGLDFTYPRVVATADVNCR